MEVLKPELEKKIKSELFDPKQFKDSPDMIKSIAHAYIVDFAERSAADWIFKFIDNAIKEKEGLEKKERGEVEEDKFQIGK